MRLNATIETRFNPRNNAFGFMRFFLAALVIVSHALPIGGFPNNDPLLFLTQGTTTIGTAAVTGFFALSGFLITRSYFSSGGFLQFMWRRFLRIFPGFWVCLIVTAFIFAPLLVLLEKRGFDNFFSSGDSPFRYIYANFFLYIRQWNVAGLPAQTNIAGLNGSLWTLIHEFLCYCFVGILGAVGILRRRTLTLLIAIGLWLLQLLKLHMPEVVPMIAGHAFAEAFLRLSIVFFVGALCYLYREKIPSNPVIAVVALAIYAAGSIAGYSIELESVAIGYTTLWLAFSLPLQFFESRGDFSYGLYIYAFPLQQILSKLGAPSLGYTAFVLLGIAAAFAFAWPSYKFVEKPMLNLKHIFNRDRKNENMSTKKSAEQYTRQEP